MGYKGCPHIHPDKANVTYVPALEVINCQRLFLLFQDIEQKERVMLVGFNASFPKV